MGDLRSAAGSERPDDRRRVLVDGGEAGDAAFGDVLEDDAGRLEAVLVARSIDPPLITPLLVRRALLPCI